VIRTVIAAAVVPLAVALAPVSHADPGQCSEMLPAYNPCPPGAQNWRGYSGEELNYLKDLDGRQVSYKDAPTVVDIGHQVCAIVVGQGAASWDQAVSFAEARWPGAITQAQANSAVFAANEHNLCPNTPDHSDGSYGICTSLTNPSAPCVKP
jgi:hypothetical protein